MLGIAIGDAFGAGYENLQRSIVKRFFFSNRYGKNPLFELHTPGTYTDDTQASLAVAELLFSGEKFSHENLARYLYCAYQRDKRPNYSSFTLQALGKPGSQPAFIHCSGGGRAAMMWFVKRVMTDKWDNERALAEATQLGLTSEPLKNFALNYIQTHKK